MPDRIDRISLMASLGIFIMAASIHCASAQAPTGTSPAPHAEAPLNWQSSARWRHGLFSKTSGTLLLTDSGVEFRPSRGQPMSWRFAEIQTFDLAPHRLSLTGYANRRWHLHGERSFRFDFETLLPPAVAANLAERVAKPVENGAPDASATAFATLGARHRTRRGGTNGTLRFRNTGIDYVTESGLGARSWRWADIETLARPDAFHFRVGGYRETFEFELKEPMSQKLFDRLWNDVYARGLNGLSLNGGIQP
jgi:hypothetical protein